VGFWVSRYVENFYCYPQHQTPFFLVIFLKMQIETSCLWLCYFVFVAIKERIIMHEVCIRIVSHIEYNSLIIFVLVVLELDHRSPLLNMGLRDGISVVSYY